MSDQQELRSFVGGDYNSVAFSPDGKRLTTAGENGIKISDAESGQELLSLKVAERTFSYSRDGNRLASGKQVWDAQTGKVLLSLKRYVASVALSPDGKAPGLC